MKGLFHDMAYLGTITMMLEYCNKVLASLLWWEQNMYVYISS